jgi:putative phage-type endonuclease
MITQTPGATLLGNFTPDSDEWHDARRGITGSDIGAILGVSPFKSTYTLWAEKRGLISDRIEPSIAMRMGTLFEPAIRQLFAEQHTSFTVLETGTWASKTNPAYRANPDGLIQYVDGDLGIVEIKHTSQYWAELPRTYYEQVHWYLDVLGLPFAIVAAVTGGRYTEFTVEYDKQHAAEVRDRVEAFQRLVDTNTEPDYDGSTSTYETVRTLAPGLTDTETELGHLWVNLSNAKKRYDEANTLFTSFKSATLAQMDGAKHGTYNGERVITLQAKNGKPFITFK